MLNSAGLAPVVHEISNMLSALLLTMAALNAMADTPPTLPIDEPVTAVIRADAPVIKTERLQAYTDEVRGMQFRLSVPDSGSYHIVARSHFFDGYLVLRDADGNVLTEDDDGWMVTYPRIFVSGMTPDATYYVDVCALHKGLGEFEIQLIRGEPAELSPEEADALELQAARRTIEVLEEREVEPLVFVIALNDLAVALASQEKYEEAKVVYERALEFATEKLGREHTRTAGLISNLAETYLAQRNYRKARALYEDALPILERTDGEDGVVVAFCLYHLGLVYQSLGDYEEARPHFERSLRIRKAKLGRRDPLIADSLRALAEVLMILGSYEESRPLYEQAHSIYRRTYGPRDARTAYNLGMLALLLKKQGELERAMSMYEEALTITEMSLGEDHEQATMIKNDIGKLLHDQGKYAEAKPILEDVLAMREKNFSSAHPRTATSLNNLAMLHLDLEEHERAKELLARALEMEVQMFGEEHASTVLRLSNLSIVHDRMGDLDTAKDFEMKSLAARRAILDRQLSSLSESERLRWAARQRRSIDHVLSISRRLGEGDAAAYEEVLSWKGNVSRGLLQERAWLAEQADPAALEVQKELADVLTELSGSFFAQDTGGQGMALETLRNRRDELERELAKKAAKGKGGVEADAKRLAGLLEKDEVLLDFYVYRDSDDARLIAFVLKPGAAVARVELGPVGDVREELGNHLDAIIERRDASLRGVAPAAAEPEDTATSRIREVLWEPLLDHVAGAKRVFVCPDGELATLPFETIPGAEEGSFLIEEHGFVYLQSALELAAHSKKRATSGKGALFVGGVDYDAEPSGERDGASNGDAERPFEGTGTFVELYGTLPEVEALGALYEKRGSKGAEVVLLSGAEATEAGVKDAVRGREHVHLATHGFFASEGVESMLDTAYDESQTVRNADGEFETREDDLVGLLPGLLSGLVFAGANHASRTAGDGILTAEEVSWLDLSACSLVTLSACETGLGTPQGGEHLIGLRRSLNLAGAASTLTSLWKVDDEATRELMQDFYERLWIRGESKLDALRGAQLAQLERNRRMYEAPLPSTWGAFVLEGDWR